jgi:hypothetical protein
MGVSDIAHAKAKAARNGVTYWYCCAEEGVDFFAPPSAEIIPFKPTEAA